MKINLLKIITLSFFLHLPLIDAMHPCRNATQINIIHYQLNLGFSGGLIGAGIYCTKSGIQKAFKTGPNICEQLKNVHKISTGLTMIGLGITNCASIVLQACPENSK